MSAPHRLYAAVLAAGSLTLAACGSSGTGTSASSSSSQTSASGGSNAAITVAAASVPGVGTVLVNGDGRTLYMLTSEKGGATFTCTDDNGCTKVWPDTELPAGTTQPIAGSGIDASKLSTVKNASGNLYITYAGWPLYTYTGDSGPGQAKGLGIVSFGGTWYPLSPAGAEITSSSGSSGGGTTTSSSNGYGY